MFLFSLGYKGLQPGVAAQPIAISKQILKIDCSTHAAKI
jgi:hypothetical protein